MTEKQEKHYEKIFARWKKSPLDFIKDVWGLTPERDNSKFIKYKNITWQQEDVLKAIEDSVAGKGSKRISIRAGRGVGKTAMVAWIILWALFTHKDSQLACTAPTITTLQDALWKQCAFWLEKMPKEYKKHFDMTLSHIRMKPDSADKEGSKTWFARAKTASKENPEALAGVHSTSFVGLICDESSGIPDDTYTSVEGSLTEKNYLFLMISNPTRLVGYFKKSFDKPSWRNFAFSVLESPLVETEFVDSIMADYGKDSDEYRVQVLGEFPSADSVDDKGYVPLLIKDEIQYITDSQTFYRPTMGIDPAGTGRNDTIWVIKDHFRAKQIAREKISNPKSIAQKTITLMGVYNIHAANVTVDNFGVGANVAKEMMFAGRDINAINVGDKPYDEKFMNLRAEMYWRAREWVKKGGQFVRTKDWDQLLNIKYRSELSGKTRIMPKRDMIKDGYGSPDTADAFSMCFYRAEFFAPENRLTEEEVVDITNIY